MEGVVGQHWVAEEGDKQVSGRQVDQEPVKWGPELMQKKYWLDFFTKLYLNKTIRMPKLAVNANVIG